MRMQTLGCLLELAALGGDKEYVKISSGQLGAKLGKSQQTASRLILAMEQEGLILRRREGKNQTIMIASPGLDELRSLHQVLSRIFEGIMLQGEIFTGIGEGAYYMSQEGYRSQFREKLGFDPFPGTLNLRVSSQIVDELRLKPGIEIGGFVSGNRSFGGGRCHRVRLKPGMEGAVFIPDRTHYPADVLEVVSAVNLRAALGLRDGDVICMVVLPT